MGMDTLPVFVKFLPDSGFRKRDRFSLTIPGGQGGISVGKAKDEVHMTTITYILFWLKKKEIWQIFY